MASDTELLKEIARDVADIRKRVVHLEVSLNEIDSDLHEVRPDYIEKLKKIEAEGTISKEEFERRFGVSI